MFENFEKYISSHISLTKEEIDLIRSLAVMRKLRRRQFLSHEGDVCRHKVFVAKGLLRTYQVKNDGTEHIMRFACENMWSVDSESYNSQTPSKYNIEAIEDTELVLWTRENADSLFAAIPAYKDFSDSLKASTLDASQNRVLMNISCTAEEKYQDFMNSFPEIFRRVPLHMVASYLGLSRETLSRIRRTLA